MNGMWFGVAPRYKKDMFVERDWTICSEYDHHSKLNNQ